MVVSAEESLNSLRVFFGIWFRILDMSWIGFGQSRKFASMARQENLDDHEADLRGAISVDRETLVEWTPHLLYKSGS